MEQEKEREGLLFLLLDFPGTADRLHTIPFAKPSKSR